VKEENRSGKKYETTRIAVADLTEEGLSGPEGADLGNKKDPTITWVGAQKSGNAYRIKVEKGVRPDAGPTLYSAAVGGKQTQTDARKEHPTTKKEKKNRRTSEITPPTKDLTFSRGYAPHHYHTFKILGLLKRSYRV